jgi:hypothetical protein
VFGLTAGAILWRLIEMDEEVLAAPAEVCDAAAGELAAEFVRGEPLG